MTTSTRDVAVMVWFCASTGSGTTMANENSLEYAVQFLVCPEAGLE